MQRRTAFSHPPRGARGSGFGALVLASFGFLASCGDGDGSGGPSLSYAGGAAAGRPSELHLVCGASGGGPALASGGGPALATSTGGALASLGGAAQGTGGDALTTTTGGSTLGAGGDSFAATGGTGLSGGAASAPATATPLVELKAPPMLFAPTSTSFSINAIVSAGNPERLRATVQEEGTAISAGSTVERYPTADTIEWTSSELQPGRRYQYQIITPMSDGSEAVLCTGTATTQRASGESFTFDLLTDSHVSPHEDPVQYYEVSAATTTPQVASDIAASNPDFAVHLGDVLDFHMFGFGLPPPDGSWTKLGYEVYRGLMGTTLSNVAHFSTIGTWDGENGYFADDEIAFSRAARRAFLPGPTSTTYPEGGSEYGDYYAFTWGDALFIVLNSETYTTTAHRLSWDPGVPDDWTLGEAQMAWFRQTLENATAPWRFVMIHHPVGGNAGDSDDTAYGRGGGRAAYVGEQAEVHALMMQYGVQIFFYGHDHVFTDMVVDNIHYSLPGSAGAPTSWMFDSSITGYTDYWMESGHGRVDVSRDSVHVQFLGLGGSLLYEYTLTR